MSNASPVPSPTDIARIAAMGNRVLRNLEITECYAQLSTAMRARTGGSAANWCTFACWASRQAGSTIRGEDLLDRFQRHLGRAANLLAPLQSLGRVLLRHGLFAPDTRLGRAVAEIHTPFDAFERASDAVAGGNLKVFEEIGRQFARFLAMVPSDARIESNEYLAFAADLKPGPPPDGQAYLTEAFAHYQQQGHETGPVRAALILLANLKIGLHEQTRLQPQIAEAVDTPVDTAEDLGTRVLHLLMPGARRWPWLVHQPSAWTLGWLALRLRGIAVKVTRAIVTESMMVLALPNVVLALGQDLRAELPPTLADNRHPALEVFVREYDSCPPGDTRCGARDWTDLRQRMHYILHLFRAFAEEPSLFSSPFTDAQVARFRAGVVPDGEI